MNVTSYRYNSAAQFLYTVRMYGGVSIWLKNVTAIPSNKENNARRGSSDYNWYSLPRLMMSLHSLHDGIKRAQICVMSL